MYLLSVKSVTKYDANPFKFELKITSTATWPIQIIPIRHYNIIDLFLKYAQTYLINSSQGIEIADQIVQYFTHHLVVRELLEVHKIQIHFISSQHSGFINYYHSRVIVHIGLLNDQN